MQQQNTPKAVIEYYAQLPTSGNADAIVPGYDSVVREAMGDIGLRDYLAKVVLPFFADSQSVDRKDTVTPAPLPAGRSGEIHYTYRVTRNNTFKPIVFAMVKQSTSLRSP